MISKIVTKEEQTQMKPDEVLNDLMDGNQRFVNTNFSQRNLQSQQRDAVGGQNPKAVVLSCIDSRVPVETVFDQGIGDVFVARVAGNFENTDILGSMEYACKVAGSKLVLVLGHEKCGAVSAACDHVKLGNITAMLKNIEPAVDAASADGERNSLNPAFVEAVVQKNVELTIDRIREKSPILVYLEIGP